LGQVYFLGDASVPLDLLLLTNDIPSTGITSAITVSVRHRDTDNYLDFSDNIIKSLASAISASQALVEFSGGLYRTTFNSTIDTSNIKNGTTLTAEYKDNNGGRVVEDILFQKPPAGVNDIVVGGHGNITIKGAFTKEDRDRIKRIEKDVRAGQDLLDVISNLMGNLQKNVEAKKTSPSDLGEIKRLKSIVDEMERKVIYYMTPQLPLDKLESRIETLSKNGDGEQVSHT